MGKKINLLNDLFPKVDEAVNGEYYDKESEDTGYLSRLKYYGG